MTSFQFLIPLCFYILLINYFFKKRFKIGFWRAWSESGSKIKDIDVLMPFVVIAIAYVLALTTDFVITGLTSWL